MKVQRNRRLVALALSALAVCAFLAAGCVVREPFVARDVRTLRGSGKVYLVPVNGYPASALEELAVHYGRKYGLPAEVKPGLRTPPEAYHEAREQLIAEEVAAALRREYKLLHGKREPTVIAVTGDDMYIRGKDWGYAFSYREEAVAVVSSARMDHDGVLGIWEASEERQKSRLRKMVTKNIGMLYYRLPLSNDPRSVMYGNVGGPQELDRMKEDF